MFLLIHSQPYYSQREVKRRAEVEEEEAAEVALLNQVKWRHLTMSQVAKEAEAGIKMGKINIMVITIKIIMEGARRETVDSQVRKMFQIRKFQKIEVNQKVSKESITESFLVMND